MCLWSLVWKSSPIACKSLHIMWVCYYFPLKNMIRCWGNLPCEIDPMSKLAYKWRYRLWLMLLSHWPYPWFNLVARCWQAYTVGRHGCCSRMGVWKCTDVLRSWVPHKRRLWTPHFTYPMGMERWKLKISPPLLRPVSPEKQQRGCSLGVPRCAYVHRQGPLC